MYEGQKHREGKTTIRHHFIAHDGPKAANLCRKRCKEVSGESNEHYSIGPVDEDNIQAPTNPWESNNFPPAEFMFSERNIVNIDKDT